MADGGGRTFTCRDRPLVPPTPLALRNCNPLPSPDHLYHLGLHTLQDLPALFGDLRAVLLMGSPDRARHMAHRFAAESHGVVLQVGKTERYHLFKVGPVLFASHGIGQASLSILLHELAKLLHYSGAGVVPIHRIGTSGGVGVPGGTVVITTHALSGELREEFCIPILGKMTARSTDGFDPALGEALYGCRGDLPVVKGKTMAADCFYDGQGRLDGSICDHTEVAKAAFLATLHGLGVRNVEMECAYLGAFGKHLGLPVACVCVCLLNRMEGDQITLTATQMEACVTRSTDLVLRWLHQYLLGLCAPPSAP